ncbi:unnamed protein product [Symbiodinium sp. CCMP2592]|nr:unnamed protein product [Symbiodinium sp. CCMP2592]
MSCPAHVSIDCGGVSFWDREDLQAVVPGTTTVRGVPKGAKGTTKVNKVLVKGKGGQNVGPQKSERRISVGSDLAYSGTYTGPSAAGRAKRGNR